MAEHFLDDAEVGAALDEVRGEGVAEGVGGDFFVDPGEQRLVLDEVEDGHPAERAAVFVEEGDVVEGGFGGLGTRIEVGAEGVCRHFAERHEALFVALADHAHEALLEVDVRDLQAAGFGDAQAAAVEDFEDGAVAQSGPAAGGVDGFEDGRNLLDAKDFREVATELRCLDAVAGVVGAFALEDQPVEEGSQRAQQPRLAAFAQWLGFLRYSRLLFRYSGLLFRHSGLLFRHSGLRPGISRPPDQVPFDVVRAHRPWGQVGRREEFRHVARVGRHRVRRQPALHPQVVAVVF